MEAPRLVGDFGFIASEFAHVWTVEAGLIVAFRQIADTAAIGAAIGLARFGFRPRLRSTPSSGRWNLARSAL